jgi:sugar lactone lactonase YvrE
MSLHRLEIVVCALAVFMAVGCDSDSSPSTAPPPDSPGGNMPFEQGVALDLVDPGELLPFTPLPQSATCAVGGTSQQLQLPTGYVQTLVAHEGEGYPDLPDMQTVNETGPDAGRFLYRTHELSTNAAVSVTDLESGFTTILAQRPDWERFDGLVWTPWGTLLAAEEADPSAVKDPTQPDVTGGHVYEIDPSSGTSRVVTGLGAKAHEGIRFDKQGNVYGISENDPGYIYRFVPATRGDLSRGELFALKLVTDLGDRTGWGEWVKLDSAAARIDAQTEAGAKGATSWSRPEDVEIGTSTGRDRRGNHTLYVAVTGEDRVLAIDLHPAGGAPGQVFVSDYVREGVNAPPDFDFPDNLALDRSGNLYITEDPGGNGAEGKTSGDDVWFAPFNDATAARSMPAQRFLSLTDCDAEPTGIYLSPSGRSLFIDIQHRGGASPEDQTYAIWKLRDVSFLKQAP